MAKKKALEEKSYGVQEFYRGKWQPIQVKVGETAKGEAKWADKVVKITEKQAEELNRDSANKKKPFSGDVKYVLLKKQPTKD